jgi:hypothetical protein
VQIVDRRGTLVTVLQRAARGSLEAAWVRIPDGSWLGIEPRATTDAPWGWSDRVWHASAPPRAGWHGTPLTLFEALDWSRIDRIPALAEPARLPSGGGTAVLNLVASLAAEQGVARLAYAGPYPTEQLFLALLESFHYESVADDPLAAFMQGTLAWRPAPSTRLFIADDLYVQLRDRIEKVVWRGIAYYRPDWQGVTRQAPRRVVDAPGGACCTLWALDRRLDDHLLLRADGDLVSVLAVEPAASAPRPLAPSVRAGVAAVVAARAAAPLAPFVETVAAGLTLEWGPVARDLVLIDGDRVRLSTRLRDALLERLATGATPAERAALGVATIAEIAALVGDALRGRAQAAMLSLPPEAQEAALAGAASGAGATRARDIILAVDALLAEVGG